MWCVFVLAIGSSSAEVEKVCVRLSGGVKVKSSCRGTVHFEGYAGQILFMAMKATRNIRIPTQISQKQTTVMSTGRVNKQYLT
jgi:hypothetical protein